MQLVLNHNEIFTNAPEEGFCVDAPLEQRKRFAQFFTPYPIARFMARWIIGNSSCQTILDPAIGLGVFFRALVEQSAKPYHLIGYDIDPMILHSARRLLKGLPVARPVEVVSKDYMFNDWSNKYDGIICNPPYLKFHDYENLSILEEFSNRFGMALSGFTNLYTLFLLKAANQLSENGRAAFIVPSEFLNSDYGKAVKSYLIQNRTLRYIIVFDFSSNLFNNAQTTSSILLFSNDNNDRGLKFISLESVDELDRLADQLADYPHARTKGKATPFSKLDETIKWRAYYQKQNASTFRNLVSLSTYGSVVRGIATGDNDYFTFNEEKARRFHIDDGFLLPCITKAALVRSPFFTMSDFNQLRDQNKNIYLLDAAHRPDKNVREYIALGEKLGVHEKYLPSHRTPWYSNETRPPAPIWVSVFNRGGLRFVRNEANIRNLTTFHCVYLNMFASERADILFAYLLTDVSKHIFKDNRREYGNGLEKFEPNDLNSASVIDLDAIQPPEMRQILELYNTFRNASLNNQAAPSILDSLNELFKRILVA